MEKTANIYVRIEPEIKAKAEAILSEMGLNPSTAINMFYRQIIKKNGLPFETSNPPVPDISKLTKEEILNEIEKGINDMKEGKTKLAEEVFAEIEKKYNL